MAKTRAAKEDAGGVAVMPEPLNRSLSVTNPPFSLFLEYSSFNRVGSL